MINILKRSLITFLAILICVSVCITAFAVDDQSMNYVWDNMFLGAKGFVTGLVSHPLDSDVIYARTDVGGMYEYDHQQEKWIQLLDWLEKDKRVLRQVRSVAVDPNNANIVYAACGNGTVDDILKSEDKGQTWTFLDFKTKSGGGCFRGNGTRARVTGELIAVDPKNSDVIYVGTTGQGVFITLDGGETFSRIESIPTSSNMTFSSSYDNGAVSFVYIADSDEIDQRSSEIYVGSFGNGIYKSIDGGVTFTLITEGFVGSKNNGTLEVPCRVQKVGDKLYASSYKFGETDMGGFFVYENNIWTDISPTGNLYGALGFNAFIVDERNTNNILLVSAPWSNEHKVFRSITGGRMWTVKGSLGDVSALLLDPKNSSGVYAAYGSGVRYINNFDNIFNVLSGDVTYTSVDNGIEELLCSKIVSMPNYENTDNIPQSLIQCWDHGMVVVDDYDSDIMAKKSTPGFHYGGGVDYCEENPSYVLRTGQVGGSNNGFATLAISTDYGNTFTDKTWDNWTNDSNSMSNSWTSQNESDNYSTTQLTDPERVGWNPNLRIVDCAVGATYQDEIEYPILMIHSVGHKSVQNPSINSGYGRGAGSGIYRSEDNGLTWIKTDVEVERCSSASYYNCINLSSDRVDGKTFYYVNSKLDVDKTWLEVTQDGGITWTRLHEGQKDNSLFTQYSTIKSVPYTKGAFWVLGKNGTVYSSYDFGVTLNSVSTIKNVEAFGFGKGSVEDVPAVYALGEVGNVYGMYISVDLGAHWVKISTDSQTFSAGAIDICGDSNVYGTVYVATAGRGALYGVGEPIIATSAKNYSSGDKLVLKATIDNTLLNEENIKIIACFYDLKGNLVDVYSDECVIEPHKREQECILEVKVPDFRYATKMKGFIFDNGANIMPLFDNIILE